MVRSSGRLLALDLLYNDPDNKLCVFHIRLSILYDFSAAGEAKLAAARTTLEFPSGRLSSLLAADFITAKVGSRGK